MDRLRYLGRRLHAGDLYALTAIGLGILLFQPLTAAGLPQAPDALLHFYRVVLWSDAWRTGAWWPRWHTALYQGYGYPLFNFYAPLLYAGSAAFAYLARDVEAGFKAMLLLACLAYPLGMYLWARDLLGRPAALVAAAAYAFAAYRFRELYIVGGYAQFLAWALYPWILFCFRGLAHTRRAGWFLAAVGTLAALLLTHNISALLFAPVCAAYLAGLAIAARDRRTWLLLPAAALLGLGLAAIFWLPALAEAPLTHVRTLTAGIWAVENNFLRPADLLAAMPPLDERALNPVMPYTFGRLHLALAAMGALALLRPGLRPATRGFVALSALGAALSALMTLPISRPIWEVVPLLRFVEFPSRMYGVALLFSSVLCGAALLWLASRPRLASAAAAVLVSGLVLAVAVYQFPRPFIQMPPALGAYLRYETAFHAMGTTAGGEYLPTWTAALPGRSALQPDLTREALAQPRPDQTGAVLAAGPDWLKLRVSQPVASSLVVAQIYFPGWQAQIDGVPAPLGPAERTGLIQLAAPAGQHDIMLTFCDTPVRRAAELISLLAAAAALGLAWRLRKRAGPSGYKPDLRDNLDSGQTAPSVGHACSVTPGRRTQASGLPLLALVAAFIVLKAAWIGPHTSLFRFASPPGAAQPAQYRLTGVGEGGVALLGYDLERDSVRQGDELHVRLYWQALHPLGEDYASYVQLIAGPEHTLFAQANHQHPGNLPARAWPTTGYVVDDFYIPVGPATPPVQFHLEAGLYRQATGDRLATLDLPARVYVTERQPIRPASDAGSARTRFGDHITLLGRRVERDPDGLNVTLYWQADAPPGADYQVFIHGLGRDGATLLGQDGAPLAGLYPTSAWRPGQVIADTHRIPLDRAGQAGLAALELGLYDLRDGQRLPAVAPDKTRWPNDALVIALLVQPR